MLKLLVYLAWNGFAPPCRFLECICSAYQPRWPPRRRGTFLSNGGVSVAVSRVATVKISRVASWAGAHRIL